MLAIANAAVDFLANVALPIAHDIGYPHQEPPPEPAGGSGGGASAVVILVGVIVTLAAVAALVWLKQRTSATGSARTELPADPHRLSAGHPHSGDT